MALQMQRSGVDRGQRIKRDQRVGSNIMSATTSSLCAISVASSFFCVLFDLWEQSCRHGVCVIGRVGQQDRRLCPLSVALLE